MTLPIVRLIDNHFGHAATCCNGNLRILPKYFQWDRTSARQSITVFTGGAWTDPDISAALRRVNGYGIKVWWLMEPPVITPTVYAMARDPSICALFDYILTCDTALIASNPDKFKFAPYGGCWILPHERRIYPKSKNISIIASDKLGTFHYNLRHELGRRYSGKIDGFGNAFQNNIESKLEGLKDYRFTVVIENSEFDNYFTEKLIDPLVTGTIPIYLGSPSVFNMFPGVIPISQLEEVISYPDAYYRNAWDARQIENNFVSAQSFTNTEDWLWLNFFSKL